MVDDTERKQFILNKSINLFLDTKGIYDNSQKLKKIDIETLIRKIIKLNKFLKKKKINRKKKIIKINKYKSNFFNKKFFDIRFKKLNTLVNSSEFFEEFLVHGSFASKDYISGWSDIDTFVVIRNTVLETRERLISLREYVKKLYDIFFQVCPLQHHGLICFSTHDLDNYLKAYMPLEALKYNFSFFNKKNFFVYENKKKFNNSIKSILDRKNSLQKALQTGFLNHHKRHGIPLYHPLSSKKFQMYQLFCQVGYNNTLPAYFLTSINNSTSKKKSFSVINKYFKNKKFKKFLNKGEKVRKEWKRNFYNRHERIPKKIIEILGSNYLEESYNNYCFLLKMIKSNKPI